MGRAYCAKLLFRWIVIAQQFPNPGPRQLAAPAFAGNLQALSFPSMAPNTLGAIAGATIRYDYGEIIDSVVETNLSFERASERATSLCHNRIARSVRQGTSRLIVQLPSDMILHPPRAERRWHGMPSN